MAARKQSTIEAGKDLRRKLLDEASTVMESSKRVQQLALPMAMGSKTDIDQRLDPSRTWRSKR